LRANLRREHPQTIAQGEGGKLIGVGEKLTGWGVSPVWANAGSTNAQDFRGWFDIKAFETLAGAKIGPDNCPSSVAPVPIPEPTSIAQGGVITQLAKTLSVEDAVRAKDQPVYILMWGHIEYRDAFPETPMHHHDWCVAVIPNDIPKGIFSFLTIKEHVD
jgi:hypothetical protein